MKRIFSFILALAMVFTSCYGAVFAVSTPQTRASLTLSSYSASLKASSRGGEVIIRYNVQPSKRADSVGIESIDIYKSDGSYITTITGTTDNGLICSNTSIHSGTYSYTLTSGFSYYAKVTVFAEVGTDYDSQVVTTGTIKVP